MKDSIILYSQPTCPMCHALKTELNKHNIIFSECQDVEQMMQKGIKRTPVLEINGNFFAMKEALKWIKENY